MAELDRAVANHARTCGGMARERCG